MKVYTEFQVTDFESYKELFKTLHMVALENPGVMPILVLNDEQD